MIDQLSPQDRVGAPNLTKALALGANASLPALGEVARDGSWFTFYEYG